MSWRRPKIIPSRGETREHMFLRFGCRNAKTRAPLLLLALTVAASSPAATAVTFGHDIAPIIYKHCSPCHRPGESAPFSLLTYDDVKAHAGLIASAVASRRMPPWLPDPERSHFIEERRLSDSQIRQFLDWIKQGSQKGADSEIPPVPDFTTGWQLGRPDLVLEASQAISVPA